MEAAAVRELSDETLVGEPYLPPRFVRPAKLLVRSDGHASSQTVAAVLERCSLSPAWPFGTLQATVTACPAFLGRFCFVDCTFVTSCSRAGEPRMLHFGENIKPGTPPQIAQQFFGVLARLVLHELQETLCFEGKLLRDPHPAGGS